MTPAWHGRRIALLTQHGKERVLAPVLEPALGCRLERVDGFDTDQLGSFTREIPRPGTQLEAARRKARMGMTLSGARAGLASEGSFGPDPFTGLFPWNVELLVLIDDELGLEVSAVAQGPAGTGSLRTGDWPTLEAWARREGFPAQQLVLRPDDEHQPCSAKGVDSWERLRAGFEAAQAQARSGQVWAEADLRAFASPARMARIGEAGQALLRQLAVNCPACGRPGFAVSAHQPGRPCAECGAPTRQALREIRRCSGCGHEAAQPVGDGTPADPRHCEHCNP